MNIIGNMHTNVDHKLRIDQIKLVNSDDFPYKLRTLLSVKNKQPYFILAFVTCILYPILS